MRKLNKALYFSDKARLISIFVLIFLILPATIFAVNPTSASKIVVQGQKVKYATKLANYGIKSINKADLAIASKAENITTLLEYERNTGNITELQVHRYIKGFNSLEKGDELLLECLQNKACNVEKYMSQLTTADNIKNLPKHKTPNNAISSTSSPSTILGNNLEQAGQKRLPGYEAHHIVPFSDPRAATARRVLEKYKIDLNSVENGCWLRGPKSSSKRGVSHRSVNTNKYNQEINRRLAGATSREEAIEALEAIKSALCGPNVTFPYK